MIKIRKNMFGYVHHAVLGMVVVGLVAVIGVKVLEGTHAASPPAYTNGKIFARKYTINPNGSAFKELAVPTDFDSSYANMSADGTRLAYLAKGTSPRKVKVGTISSGYITDVKVIGQLPYKDVVGDIYKPVGPVLWSPDGSKVAILANTFNWYQVLIARTDASGSRLVKNLDEPGSGGKWSYSITAIGWFPGSQNIIFTTSNVRPNADVNGLVCTISTGGDNKSCFHIAPYQQNTSPWVEGLTVSPGGYRVALLYSHWGKFNKYYDIYTVNTGDGNNVQHIKSFPADAVVHALVWSPDRTKIAYSVNNNGANNNGLWAMEADGSATTIIRYYDDLVSQSLSWAHQ